MAQMLDRASDVLRQLDSRECAIVIQVSGDLGMLVPISGPSLRLLIDFIGNTTPEVVYMAYNWINDHLLTINAVGTFAFCQGQTPNASIIQS